MDTPSSSHWQTTLSSPPLLAVAVVLSAGAVAAFIAAITAPGSDATVLFAILAVVAVVTISCSRMTLTLDAARLVVRSTSLRFAWKSIPLDSIEHVREEHVSALAWGGWGYRIQMGRSAAVLRSGPGLVFLLNNGKEFSVSVPEAPQLLALIERLR